MFVRSVCGPGLLVLRSGCGWLEERAARITWLVAWSRGGSSTGPTECASVAHRRQPGVLMMALAGTNSHHLSMSS